MSMKEITVEAMKNEADDTVQDRANHTSFGSKPRLSVFNRSTVPDCCSYSPSFTQVEPRPPFGSFMPIRSQVSKIKHEENK